MSRNIDTVKALYAAFGAGDVSSILSRLAPDVEWEHDFVDHGIPWVKARRGIAEIPGFFGLLADTVVFDRFEPHLFLEDGDHVMSTVYIGATVRANGTRLDDYEAHLFTFGADGKVKKFRHFLDTLAHARAGGAA